MVKGIRDRPAEFEETVKSLEEKIKQIEETGQVEDEDLDEAGLQAKASEKKSKTRREQREQRKLDEWKAQVEEATGLSYDDSIKADLTPSQMQEALLQMQSELRPSTRPVKGKNGKKYQVDELTGEKTRAASDRKGKYPSKSKRKQASSRRFFDNL